MLDDFQRLNLLLDRRQAIRMALLFAGLLLAAALEMIGLGSIPIFVGLLADPERVLASVPAGTVGNWLAGIEPAALALYGALVLAGIFIVKNIYLAGLAYAEQRIVRDVTASVSNRLFRTYLYSPYAFHLQRNPAKLVRNTTNEAAQAIQLISSAMKMTREILVLVVVFALLLIMDPWVSLSVFLLLGLATGAFYLQVRTTLARRGRYAQQHRARLLKAVNHGLGAIKDAKILGREPYLSAAFDHEVRGLHHQQLYQRMVAELPRLYLETLAVLAIVVVSTTFVLLGRPIQDMLPVLALLAVAVVRLVPAFTVITRALSQMRFQRPSLELVCNELRDMEPNVPVIPRPSARQTAAPDAFQELTLDDVHFRYPGASVDALSRVSLNIRRGEAVAFIGPSGSGKSTLVDVILGLLLPTQGQVRVNGVDTRHCLTAWQRRIGYIPQDIYLLDDSIRRNIAFGLGDNDIDDASVANALEAAHLGAFVEGLPEGLDTVIGNRGIRLSGGQRQRLGIARALYHNPQVLVMDEATSALDHETERDVISAINRLRGDRTILMIAHRMTTVAGCDRLYLFGKKRRSAQGRSGYALARKQSRPVPGYL